VTNEVPQGLNSLLKNFPPPEFPCGFTPRLIGLDLAAQLKLRPFKTKNRSGLFSKL
jgi:hypothetical protein